MLLSDVAQRQKYVSNIRRTLTFLTNTLGEIYGGQEVVSELAEMRGYSDIRMINYLSTKGIFKAPPLSDITIIASRYGLHLDQQTLTHLGITSLQGDYFLQSRFVLPLRTWSGRVQAWVCWYPDKRKYITTGTLGFTTVASFFNMESYVEAFKYPDGVSRVFVVEGIFDALSIASLGYCAFGNQGLDLSPLKKEMLSRFDEVYFIPDNDAPGNKSNKYLCKSSTHLWDTPNGRLIKLDGSVKDMDDMIKACQPANLDMLMTKSPLLRVQIK